METATDYLIVTVPRLLEEMDIGVFSVRCAVNRRETTNILPKDMIFRTDSNRLKNFYIL